MNKYLNKITELRQERAKAIADARTIMEGAEKENRHMSAEEGTSYDKAYKESVDLNVDIKRYEQMANEERADIETPSKVEGSIEQRQKTILNNVLKTGNQGAYESEMRAAQMDNPTQAGYIVPTEQFVNELIKEIDDAVFIRTVARKFTLNGAHSLGIPERTDDMSDIAWTSEIGSASEDSSLKYGKRELKPNHLAKLIKVSKPLIRNSNMIVDEVRSRMAYKFGVAMENGYMNGDGVNKPLGVFTASTNGISTGRDVAGSNTATLIKADTLRDMKYNLKAQYRNNATWTFHRDALLQISKLKDGEGQYLWAPGIRVGDPDMILNLGLRESEFAPNTYTAGLYAGLLGDWSKYWIADSLEFTIQVLMELYAVTNQVGYVGRAESDGMPTIENAFTRMKMGA
jgi:HK97 family phage major capsid protein